MPPDNYVRVAKEIDRADAKMLRTVVKALCYQNNLVSEKVEQWFLGSPATPAVPAIPAALAAPAYPTASMAPATSAAPTRTERKATGGAASASVSTVKRLKPAELVPALRKCYNCGYHFDTNENHHGACQTHTAGVRIDQSYFPDDDDIECDSYYPDDWTRTSKFDDFPEGFIWECCNQRGNIEGCVVQKHIVSDDGKSTATKPARASIIGYRR